MKIKKKIFLFNKNLERAIQAVAIREVLGQYFSVAIIVIIMFFIVFFF